MSIMPIAFYLPQFHPIPENDQWWGEGFTEWTNVKKAKPLFPGHHQPVEPGELGYYDLRNPDVRMKQAELAKEHGVYGFCYWHYWFGNGKMLLERLFQEVLKSGQPDFPFCLGWANESWTGIWHGAPDKILMKQTYPGDEDIKKHFDYLLPIFSDNRYIRINNKPFFLIYKPSEHPNLNHFTTLFNELAVKNGFDGIHFVATNVSEKWDSDHFGFQAIAPSYHNRVRLIKKSKWKRFINKIYPEKNRLDLPEHIYPYKEAIKYFLPGKFVKDRYYPVAVPNWDNSPRSGKRAVILTGSTPALFEEHLKAAVSFAQKNSANNRIILIKSWNEWAEGNYLEPDKKWGRAYLEKMKSVVDEYDLRQENVY